MLVKICGLTKASEAAYLNEYGSDMAGFVLFYPKSKRNISIEAAKAIMKELKDNIKTVAVCVEPTMEQLLSIEESGFDYIQIHGELDSQIYNVAKIPILMAINVDKVADISRYVACEKIEGIVFDGKVPGGGKTFDWKLISHVNMDNKKLILAGGLDCNNVYQAIKSTKADIIDVSSGVEYDGTEFRGKDPKKIKEFIKIVKRSNENE